MARISELHYSNAYARTSGVDEFLEVALGASDDPADFTVSFYQSNGTVGEQISLDHPDVQVTVDPDNGEVVYVISAEDFNILLTDPNGGGANNYEAFALVNTDTNTVIDFYDIGGGTQNITAVNGLAAGAISENVPVLVGPNQTTTTLQWNQPDPDTVTYSTVGAGDTGLACFTLGTRIHTPQGWRLIDHLQVGDLVTTRDHGAQPLRWIGHRTVRGEGQFAPVEFAAGALGAFEPLRVSPQHRMLLRGWRVELACAEREVFVPALTLVNGTTIRQISVAEITYVHLLFDRHQVIRANGVESESMLLTARAMDAWTQASQDEVLALFPELRTSAEPWSLARPIQPAHLATLLR